MLPINKRGGEVEREISCLNLTELGTLGIGKCRTSVLQLGTYVIEKALQGVDPRPLKISGNGNNICK